MENYLNRVGIARYAELQDCKEIELVSRVHITSIHFYRYKAFSNYSISLNNFNVLVGPNNAGKSTVLGSLRILAEAMRKARSRKPTPINGPQGYTTGYFVDLQNVPVATENVFYNYDSSEPTTITFQISNGNKLILFFPREGRCSLICDTVSKPVTSTASFKSQYNFQIGFVPILGPVEHNEILYQREAARQALLTHHAARNFRNIWYHYPDDYDQFRELIVSTWPGMDIQPPEIDYEQEKPLLRMFCPEERIPREIFWAGFGFQVWAQMLTHIVKGKGSSLFIIDEPDIYLHADVQRQLVGILKSLGPDIIIATHSTEIITEADANDLVVINKKERAGKRIKDPAQLQNVFASIGSNLNPILTQLAKTRRAIFVEGKDFQVISRYARKLGFKQIAHRSDFAVIPVEGYNPNKVKDFLQGMETTLGTKVIAGVIFDRDYRSDGEVKKEVAVLKKYCFFAHIHKRKEVENFLLEPSVIEKAIRRKVDEQNQRSTSKVVFDENIESLLDKITDEFRHMVASKYLARNRSFMKTQKLGLDDSTIDENLMREFDELWKQNDKRLLLVPGKMLLSKINSYLQEKYHITISMSLLVDCFTKAEIPDEMVEIISKIEDFRSQSIDS